MPPRSSTQRPKRAGRRAGAAGESREAILRAARVLFARLGFRGTTVRAVAKRAGVDIALVHYFFGSKSDLFAASVELPIDPERVTALLAARPSAPGEALARYYLEHLFVERSDAISAMLRAGLGDPECVPALRALIERTLVTAAAGTLGAKEARLRAELAGALMVGLFVNRCIVGVEPLGSASVDQLVSLLAPALDAFLGAGAQVRQRGDRS
ncbi:MAG TPA: TetR family transcriptional regulator [Polyangia bacterium]|nr:TetR family transcriptional regulator [Polyangia bacterium]